jgi:hypothetical protein
MSMLPYDINAARDEIDHAAYNVIAQFPEVPTTEAGFRLGIATEVSYWSQPHAAAHG